MKRVERTLFGVSNPYPQKKVMTFNKMSTNFVFNVSYGGLATMSEMERRWALFGVVIGVCTSMLPRVDCAMLS